MPACISALLFTALVFCGNKNFVSGNSLLEMITSVLKQGHYDPPKIDDAFSKKVYGNVLDKVDNDKRFFTKEDLKKLSKYEKLIDDQVNAGSYEFFDTVWSMMMRRLDLVEAHNNKVLATPFNFKGNDYYTVKDEATENPKDIAALKSEWSAWLKFQALDRLYKKLEQQRTRSEQPDSVKKDIAQ
jgi:carboxyl-terminal processing protease